MSLFLISERKMITVSLNNLKSIDIIETCDNSSGLISVSWDPTKEIVAILDNAKGFISIKDYGSQLKRNKRDN
jgi:hypothetical protein